MRGCISSLTRFKAPNGRDHNRGLTEVCRKSRDVVEGSSAEEVAAEVQNGAGAELGPAATSAFHAMLDEVLRRSFDGTGADWQVLVA